MKKVFVSFVCVVAAVVAAAAQTPAPKLTPASFAGTWAVTSINGEQGPPLQFVVTPAGDGYSVVMDGQAIEQGGLKINTGVNPMTVDLDITAGDDAGKKQLGVIELSGNSVRMKLAQPGSTVRPADFEVDGSSFVFVAEKQKIN